LPSAPLLSMATFFQTIFPFSPTNHSPPSSLCIKSKKRSQHVSEICINTPPSPSQSDAESASRHPLYILCQNPCHKQITTTFSPVFRGLEAQPPATGNEIIFNINCSNRVTMTTARATLKDLGHRVLRTQK